LFVVPELPEVETLRRGLERAQLPGQRITRAIVANTKALKKQSPALFQERVTGSAIGPIERRGKYLLLRLLPCAGATPTADTAAVSVAAPLFLCVHLKMRGQLLLEATRTPGGKYHCVTLELTGGRDLRFYDMWTWGEMRALTEAEIKQCTGVGALGREPLEENWGAADLALVLQGRKTAIKPTLLDQRVLAGVGNIYADESLYRAKIHPERPAGTLTAGERERLADALGRFWSRRSAAAARPRITMWMWTARRAPTRRACTSAAASRAIPVERL
jgi:formamidopyrimidine-DNA glycosylase